MSTVDGYSFQYSYHAESAGGPIEYILVSYQGRNKLG